MIDETLRKLIEAIQNAAPVIWEAAVRQVQSNGIVSLVWAGVCLLIIALLVGFMKANSDDMDADTGGLLLVVILATVVGFMFNLSNAIQFLYNPQWYAIQKLIDLVK